MKLSYLLQLAHKYGFKPKCSNQNHQLLQKDENGKKSKKKPLVLPDQEEIEEPLASEIIKFIKYDDEGSDGKKEDGEEDNDKKVEEEEDGENEDDDGED